MIGPERLRKRRQGKAPWPHLGEDAFARQQAHHPIQGRGIGGNRRGNPIDRARPIGEQVRDAQFGSHGDAPREAIAEHEVTQLESLWGRRGHA